MSWGPLTASQLPFTEKSVLLFMLAVAGLTLLVGLFFQPQVPQPSPQTISARLDINRAEAFDLEAIPGIGPALSERILAARERQNGFCSLADLDAISGIGPELLKKLVAVIEWPIVCGQRP